MIRLLFVYRDCVLEFNGGDDGQTHYLSKDELEHNFYFFQGRFRSKYASRSFTPVQGVNLVVKILELCGRGKCRCS